MADLVKTEHGGALVKHTHKQDVVAAGLGVAGVGLWGLSLVHLPIFIPLAASIGAVLLSWESLRTPERRTALAAGAMALGVVPLGIAGFTAISHIFFFGLSILILTALAGGAAYGGYAVFQKRKGKQE